MLIAMEHNGCDLLRVTIVVVRSSDDVLLVVSFLLRVGGGFSSTVCQVTEIEVRVRVRELEVLS